MSLMRTPLHSVHLTPSSPDVTNPIPRSTSDRNNETNRMHYRGIKKRLILN